MKKTHCNTTCNTDTESVIMYVLNFIIKIRNNDI